MRVEAAFARAEARPLELPFPIDGLQDPAATLDEKKQAVKEYISDCVATGDELVAGLEALDPPPKAEDAHEEFVLGVKGSYLALDDFRDEQLDAIESDADLTPRTVDEALLKRSAQRTHARTSRHRGEQQH